MTENEKENQTLPRFEQQARFLLQPNVIAGRTTWCCGRFEQSGLLRAPIAGLGAPCRGADLANVMAFCHPPVAGVLEASKFVPSAAPGDLSGTAVHWRARLGTDGGLHCMDNRDGVRAGQPSLSEQEDAVGRHYVQT